MIGLLRIGFAKHLPESAFQRFGAHGDRSQRIVDLVGHAGGQKPHAGQLFAAHHLLGPLLHLPIEVVANLLEAGGHVVQGVGQFGHLVVGLQPDAIGKLAGRHRAASRPRASATGGRSNDTKAARTAEKPGPPTRLPSKPRGSARDTAREPRRQSRPASRAGGWAVPWPGFAVAPVPRRASRS